MIQIKKLTGEDNSERFEVIQKKETPFAFDSYMFTLSKEEAVALKSALNDRLDI